MGPHQALKMVPAELSEAAARTPGTQGLKQLLLPTGLEAEYPRSGCGQGSSAEGEGASVLPMGVTGSLVP